MPVLRSPIGLKEFFANIRNWLTDSNGDDVKQLGEADGTERSQLVLWDGSTQRRWLSETDGTAKMSLYGKDEASNLDALRTDPNRILWNRPHEGWVEQVGVAIPSAEGIVYNPGTTAAQTYWVQYKVVNIDAGGAAVTVSVGSDASAGGSLAGAEYDMFNEVIPYPGSSGWRDLGIIAGDDDIRAIASAADDAIIRFRIRRVDTGA